MRMHPKALVSLARAFRIDVRANIVTIFALALPALAIAVTAASELAEVQSAKTELQGAVDSAAMNGAGAFSLDQSAATTERARLMADNLVDPLRKRWTIQTVAKADPVAGSLTITQTAFRHSLFGNLLPPGGFRLTAAATASANSTMPLCVLTTKLGATQVLSVANLAIVTAGACLVQSNSDIVVNTAALMTAGASRSVGAASGIILPGAVTDSPSIPDPFASMPIVVPSACTDYGTILHTGSQTLPAGVHCGIIQVQGNATLTLAPGEHYFVNANLDSSGTGSITATNVVLVLSGTSTMQFRGASSLTLEGRQSGPFAGFAVISDRNYTGTLNISASSAHELLGTIYLPKATLSVSGIGIKVADSSPWTVVVANTMIVQGTANLVINSNYSSTVVPVPSGVGPGGGGSVRLVK